MTGASSGIGRAIALELGRRGADLVLVARREAELAALAEALPSAAEVLVADLTEPRQLATVEERVADVDLLVNNAGRGGRGTFSQLDREDQAATVTLNVVALHRLSHAALSAMVPRGRGGLLNISSVAGNHPRPGGATYAATKAFVTTLTESLHEETRGTGVHVTCVQPGFTRTEMIADGDVPGFALMDAEHVARAAVDAVTRNRPVCVPGLGYRALTAAEQLVPRPVLRRLMGLARSW